MTRPVTVTVRVPVEVTLVCVVRVTPGHPGTRYARNGDPGDPPEPDEHEVVSASLELDGGAILCRLPSDDDVVSENEDAINEAASEAVSGAKWGPL